MAYNEQYYSDKKKDLEEQIGIQIGEIYYEIERLVMKKIKKQHFLEAKIAEIDRIQDEEKARVEKEEVEKKEKNKEGKPVK